MDQEIVDEAFRRFSIMGGIPRDELKSIKDVRLARQMSIEMVANRMGISKPTYHQFEKAAERECVNLKQLRRAAEVFECELVVCFRSKNKGFAKDLWDKLLPFALKHPSFARGSLPKPAQRLAYFVKEDCLANPEIRRRLGWARKTFAVWPRYIGWGKNSWPYNV